ncbi:MAG: acyl carrier protein [Butyrivibrio sp.]|jgi:acyl carrier protein|nr:acyl carrier protein [Butyrivibrio sp.]MCR4832981.1 acyl carrier protein [Butyrivibrio sp.]
MKEKLLEILNDLHEDIDFETEKDLVARKILDSFDVVTLVNEICDEFDIEITADEMMPENFKDLDSMLSLIQSKVDED